jgi:hypothetical protein
LSTCTFNIKGLSIFSAFAVESLGPREGEGRLLLCVLAVVEAWSFLDKPLMRCGRGIWTIFGWTGGKRSKEGRWKKENVSWTRSTAQMGEFEAGGVRRPVEGRFGELEQAVVLG